MKFSKKALAGLMAVCLVGGVASAWAAVTYSGNATTTASGNVDSAISLKWGETNTFTDVNFADANTIYREVSVAAPSHTNSVTHGTVTVTFKLDTGDFENLTVQVSKSALNTQTLPTDTKTLSSTTSTGTVDFTLAELDTAQIVYIKLSSTDTTAKTGASLKASLSFSESTGN